MCGVGMAIGMGEVALLTTVAAVGIALPAAGATILGRMGLHELTKFIDTKERQFTPGSWQATACKVGRWAAIGLNAIVSAVGSAVAGAAGILTVCAAVVVAVELSPLLGVAGIIVSSICLVKLAEKIAEVFQKYPCAPQYAEKPDRRLMLQNSLCWRSHTS